MDRTKDFYELISVRKETARISWCVVCIDLWANARDGTPQRIGHGTGFFYSVNEKTYLVTNWHVLTGRNPDSPTHLLPGWTTAPDSISFKYWAQREGYPLVDTDRFELYANNEPRWIECDLPYLVDLAAIELPLPSDLIVEPIQKATTVAKAPIEVGHHVVVIGFPFSRSNQIPAAVWKSATIASDTQLPVLNKIQVLLDTPGRPGMSGSPVFLTTTGVRLTNDQMALNALERLTKLSGEQSEFRAMMISFVGVYAGSYGDQEFERLNLGRMLPSGFITGMLDKGMNRPGSIHIG